MTANLWEDLVVAILSWMRTWAGVRTYLWGYRDCGWITSKPEVMPRRAAATLARSRLRGSMEHPRFPVGNVVQIEAILGAQPLLAKSHLLLGTVLRMSGNAGDSTREYQEAIQVLNEMRKDAGDKFVGRADVKAMSAEATHWAGTYNLDSPRIGILRTIACPSLPTPLKKHYWPLAE